MMAILRMQFGHPRLPSDSPPPGMLRLSHFIHSCLSSPVLALVQHSARSPAFLRFALFDPLLYLPTKQRARLEVIEEGQ